MELKTRTLLIFFSSYIVRYTVQHIYFKYWFLQYPFKILHTPDKVIVHNVCLSQCAVSNKTYHTIIQCCYMFLSLANRKRWGSSVFLQQDRMLSGDDLMLSGAAITCFAKAHEDSCGGRPVSSNVRLAEVSFCGWIILSSAALHTPHEESFSLSSLLPNPLSEWHISKLSVVLACLSGNTII